MPADDLALSFVDTNLWLYAFIDSQDADKSRLARDLILNSKIVLSVQVVNEVCFNLIRKAKFSNEQIEELIESFFGKYRVVGLDRETLVDAAKLRGRYSFSYWDSVIVSAALSANATILYSEDLQDGIVVADRLSIVNPFLQQDQKASSQSD